VAGKQWLKRAPKTVKIFKPNIHRVWVFKENGQKVRMRLCTKCLRKVRKEQVELKKRLEAKKEAQKKATKPKSKTKKKPAPKKSPARKSA